MIGCKSICFFGEVPPRHERTKKKPYAGGNRAGTACRQTDTEEEPGKLAERTSQVLSVRLFGARVQRAQLFARVKGAVLPSGCDALRHILLGIIWRIAGGRFAAPLHRVSPYPVHGVLCVTPQKGEMVAETDPTQWPRRKARHL